MAADKPLAPVSPVLDVLDTSWAPAGWTDSDDYYDDAPFGSVLGDPLMGSMIYDVSVLDATPGWQEEDAGTALDPAASEEERADLARAQRIKEKARRRDEAHRQSRRTTSSTTHRTTAPSTASRTATPLPAPGYGSAAGQVAVPQVLPQAALPQVLPQAVPPQMLPQAALPQVLPQAVPPQTFVPSAPRGYRAGQAVPGGAQSFSWDQVKPFAGWIVLLLIILVVNLF